MDWQSSWYGPNRSFAQKCLLNALLAGTLLSVYEL